jgi:hypothetical protein
MSAEVHHRRLETLDAWMWVEMFLEEGGNRLVVPASKLEGVS